MIETTVRSQTNTNSRLSRAKPKERSKAKSPSRAKPRSGPLERSHTNVAKGCHDQRELSDQGEGSPRRPTGRRSKDSAQMITDADDSTLLSQKGQAASSTPTQSPPEGQATPKAPTWTDRRTTVVNVTKAQRRSATDKLRKAEKAVSFKTRLHDLPDKARDQPRDRKDRHYSKSRGQRMAEEAITQRTGEQRACKKPKLVDSISTREPD